MVEDKFSGDGKIAGLALGYGTCFATEMVTKQGKAVSYMYRDDPKNPSDSGWMFLSGEESESYLADPKNHHICDVNIIANYDPSIVEFLDAPFGSGFEKNEAGDFVAIEEEV